MNNTATYEVYSKSDEKIWLYSDDTYTLAISDCADPDMAQETTETTPQMLAEIFSVDALKSLLAQIGHCEKLERAIAIAAGVR
jgi:hypothetical protein